MVFTEEERARWHRERRKPRDEPAPKQTCVHCHCKFDLGTGSVAEGIPLCDHCLHG